MLKKLHLKRNAMDRFALCGVWPENRFVLIHALSHQARGAVCRTCIDIATAKLSRKDAGTAERIAKETSK